MLSSGSPVSPGMSDSMTSPSGRVPRSLGRLAPKSSEGSSTNAATSNFGNATSPPRVVERARLLSNGFVTDSVRPTS